MGLASQARKVANKQGHVMAHSTPFTFEEKGKVVHALSITCLNCHQSVVVIKGRKPTGAAYESACVPPTEVPCVTGKHHLDTVGLECE